MAKVSGGEAYFPPPSLTASVCQEIAKDIRTRYTVGYAPAARNGTGSRRQIAVSVTGPGHTKLIARTRTSYWYEDAGKAG